MRSHRHRAAALVAVAALLGGCSETTPGTASAGPAPRTSASGSAPTTSTTPSTTRPKKVDLTGVDSCSLLSDAQKQQFDLVKSPATLKSSVYADATLCSINSGDFSYGVGLVAAAKNGIGEYASGVEKGELTPMTVGGFPALTGKSTTLLPSCVVYLDVADGQMIDLGVDSTKVPMDELCVRAGKIAGAIIQTISAR